MHLRSGKALKIMTKSANTGASMSSQSSQSSSQAQSTPVFAPSVGASVSTTVGATMAMPVTIETGITASTTAPTIIAAMTQSEKGTFVPPFTAGVPVSTSIPAFRNTQVRARFDDRFVNMQNLSKDQPYGMPTSMMANFHNNSTFTENANPFTLFNAHSPSSSSFFGKNAPPTLAT